MVRLIIFIGMLIPTISYASFGVEQVGAEAAGISGMWNQVMSLLPYRGMGASGIGIVVNMVLRFIVWMIGGAAVIAILIGALQIITSGLNEEGLAQGKKTIMYAILGLIFAVTAQAILSYVGSIIVMIV